MPDPVSNIFQTTLLVMYFITPAETAHINPGQKAAFEKTKIWTLQSTNQIPTENPNMCVANGKLLIQEFEQVSTIAVRAYCLCPPQQQTGSTDVCDQAKDKSRKSFESRGLTPPPATIIPIGPDTLMPTSSGAPTQ